MAKVLARELQPGHIYVENRFNKLGTVEEGDSATWLYLGRESEDMHKQYVWIYLGNLKDAKTMKDIYDKINSSYAYFEELRTLKEVYKMRTYTYFNEFQFDWGHPHLSKEAKKALSAFWPREAAVPGAIARLNGMPMKKKVALVGFETKDLKVGHLYLDRRPNVFYSEDYNKEVGVFGQYCFLYLGKVTGCSETTGRKSHEYVFLCIDLNNVKTDKDIYASINASATYKNANFYYFDRVEQAFYPFAPDDIRGDFQLDYNSPLLSKEAKGSIERCLKFAKIKCDA